MDEVKKSQANLPEAADKGVPSTDRRTALKKMAVYSAYATPALLALMHSKKAQAFSGLD